MANVTIYLPDDLAASVRAAEINVSQVCQKALAHRSGSKMEVWLRQNVGAGITGETVSEDESASDLGDQITAFSMRGAQREITGKMMSEGFTPAGRWQNTCADGAECFRNFVRSWFDRQ